MFWLRKRFVFCYPLEESFKFLYPGEMNHWVSCDNNHKRLVAKFLKGDLENPAMQDSFEKHLAVNLLAMLLKSFSIITRKIVQIVKSRNKTRETNISVFQYYESTQESANYFNSKSS